MDKLNKNQRLVVWICLAVAVAMFLHPPQATYTYTSTSALSPGLRTGGGGYDFIWNGKGVNFAQLSIQYLLLGVASWAVVTSLKRKPE